MTAQKNHKILIHALSKSTFNGRLILVGQGPLRNELEILAKSFKHL